MNGQLELSLSAPRRVALSVTQLVRTVREALELHLDEYWVVGEISNARVAPSNHFYFTLKDARSAVNVVMFNAAFRRLRFRVNDGMKVVVRGRVNLYEARGTLQFYAEEMEPRGLGALQLAFEQLKQRLGKEGLFDPAHKRALPFLPRTVGIVTALGGAGLRDMLRILLERYPGIHVIVRPALVQGAGAAAEIAQAIDELNAHGRAEVIIVGRGGGSLEDLWAFNEETVARAIYRSAAPIVSAVGHEIDYTIADFVADVRAPTPTAAAQLVVPSKLELRRRLEETAATLEGAMRSALAGNRRELAHLEVRLREPRNLLRQVRHLLRQVRQRLDEAAAELDAAMRLKVADSRRSLREISARLRTPAALVRERRLLLSRFDDRLTAAMDSALALRRRQLAEAVGRLDSLSPLKVLERGYAVVVNARNGHAVIDAASVDLGDDLDIRLNRGRLRARTTARET